MTTCAPREVRTEGHVNAGGEGALPRPQAVQGACIADASKPSFHIIHFQYYFLFNFALPNLKITSIGLVLSLM